MSWKETSSGVFQRPLSATEAGAIAYITAEKPTAREPIKINAAADFTAPYSAHEVDEAFRTAWRALRLLKEPSIASTFGPGVTEYKVPTPEELEAWLGQTFEYKSETLVEEAIKLMQQSTEFLPVCQVLSVDASSGSFKGSVIIFISHWRTEAGGCFKMLNQLFDYASEILSGGSGVNDALNNHVAGAEVALLPPDIEEMLMSGNVNSSLESQARVKKHFDNYYAHLPSIDYALKGDLSAPSSHLRLNQRTYSSSSTTALVGACKSNSISVTAAVHSAFLHAIWAAAPPEKRGRSYASLMPAQVRTRLPANSTYRHQGCWAASQILMLTVPAGLGFLESAKILKNQYTLSGTHEWMYEDMREVSRQMGMMGENMPKSEEVSVMPYFTSLGVLDNDGILPEHGRLSVERVVAYADNVGGGIVMHVWTFRGQISIQISWNAAYHSTEQVDETLDGVEKVLRKELGLDMSVEKTRSLTC